MTSISYLYLTRCLCVLYFIYIFNSIRWLSPKLDRDTSAQSKLVIIWNNVMSKTVQMVESNNLNKVNECVKCNYCHSPYHGDPYWLLYNIVCIFAYFLWAHAQSSVLTQTTNVTIYNFDYFFKNIYFSAEMRFMCAKCILFFNKTGKLVDSSQLRVPKILLCKFVAVMRI